MSIEKQIYVDQTEILKNGIVQVRTRTDIVEDGVVIASSLHRHVIEPGDDYSEEDGQVQIICAAVHTANTIATYNETLAALQK